MKTEIERVAREVRAKCLKFALSDESIGKDYHNMEDLEMMCVVASTALAKELRNRGVDINAKVVMGKFDGEEHCWVLSRGLVVDITATQFHGSYRSEVEIWPEEVATLHWEAESVGEPEEIGKVVERILR